MLPFNVLNSGHNERMFISKGKHLKNKHSDLFRTEHSPENVTYRMPMIRSIPREALVEAYNKMTGRRMDLEVPA